MADIQAVLRKAAPNANAAFVAASSDAGAIMAAAGIKTVKAQAQFIGQLAHESQFRLFAENLNYSASRLVAVWPNRFANLAAAQPFAKNPRALANKVYNGRMGNRVGTDDGWNYRGSGLAQHTGRSEFQRVEKRTGVLVVVTPDKLRDPRNANLMLRAAASFFQDRAGMLPAMERGDTTTVTKLLNGGYNGLADRRILVARAEAALAGKPIESGQGKTSVEKAEDDKKNATRTTVGAPAGGTVTGGGSKWGGLDTLTAAMIGLSVAVIIGVAAVALWRRFNRSQQVVDRMAVETIETRLAAAEVTA